MLVAPVMLAAVIGLGMMACASQAGSGNPARGPAPAAASRATGLPVGQPAVPPQFAPVAEADWTIDQPIVGGALACRNGKIRLFDCTAIDLLAYLPIRAIGGGSLNDLWGWTDSMTGREFALVARTTGTSVVEVTDPVNPRYLGDLPFHAGSEPSGWRDIKVYQHHAFIVSEGPHHGMQVFDLAQLRTVRSAPVVFQETAHYDGVASVHNLVVDEATGFAYAVGSSGGGEPCGGGLHIIDVRDPVHPGFAGCYAETLAGSRSSGYVHDAQCVIYHGPDARHRTREICVNAAEQALTVVDVTEKRQPKLLGLGRYPNVGYTHQGWLSADQRYFFLGDELDETAAFARVGQDSTKVFTRTLVFDLRDLTDPVLATEFFGLGHHTDHNLYVRGHYMYQSNYASGLRVVDVADPVHPKEVGHFAAPGLSTWSNYPYFTNHPDVIVFTSMEQGLFVVRFRERHASRR